MFIPFLKEAFPAYPVLTNLFATSNRRSTDPHFKTADKNKMFKWGIKQPVKAKNEANTMLVTQAFSQDAKILACVPLSPISGGVRSPPLIEGSLYMNQHFVKHHRYCPKCRLCTAFWTAPSLLAHKRFTAVIVTILVAKRLGQKEKMLDRNLVGLTFF
ncbi:hypothetical protein A0U40_00495 [[Bacillus] sp. KCTC 13219]|nr:hypothetical protein A0U40_00495 [[Bacillus] sp. KCTC 13219]